MSGRKWLLVASDSALDSPVFSVFQIRSRIFSTLVVTGGELGDAAALDPSEPAAEQSWPG